MEDYEVEIEELMDAVDEKGISLGSMTQAEVRHLKQKLKKILKLMEDNGLEILPDRDY